jgi:hypothetical protein
LQNNHGRAEDGADEKKIFLVATPGNENCSKGVTRRYCDILSRRMVGYTSPRWVMIPFAKNRGTNVTRSWDIFALLF